MKSSNNDSPEFSFNLDVLIPSITDWLKGTKFFFQAPNLGFTFDLSWLQDAFPGVPQKLLAALGDILLEVAKQDILTFIDNIKKVKEGEALQEMKDYQEAINVFKQVIRKDPQNYKAWFLRSLCLLLLSEFDGAIGSFESTIARRKTFEAFYYKGITHILIVDFEAALESFEQANQINSQSSELWFDKARIFEQLGRYSEAIDAYDQSIALEPTNFRAQVNRDLINGSLEENTNQLIGRSNALIEKGRYEEAIACLNKVIEIDPSRSDAWDIRGKALNRSHSYQDAIYSYQRAVKLNPQLNTAYYGMGIAFYRLKKYCLAYTALKKSVELNRELPNSWLYLGLAAYKLEYFRKAIDAYSEFCRINSDSVIGLLYKGHALRRWKKHQEALTVYHDVLKKSPGNFEAVREIEAVSYFQNDEVYLLDTSENTINSYPKQQNQGRVANNFEHSKTKNRKWFGLF
jgi:tetratricopeptide (TPR) repeat protein